jgi:hypothetical protein
MHDQVAAESDGNITCSASPPRKPARSRLRRHPTISAAVCRQPHLVCQLGSNGNRPHAQSRRRTRPSVIRSFSTACLLTDGKTDARVSRR